MYFWNTRALANDIKNNVLTENDWKNYYMAGSIIYTLSYYLSALSPRTNNHAFITEVILIIGIIIFGVQITYKTNQKGKNPGTNYVGRFIALSLPILIQLMAISFLYGLLLGMFSASLAITPEMQEWSLAILTIVMQIFIFWRINVYLEFINA